MKYCKRYLSVFVAFLLLFVTFSTTSVSAETIHKLNAKINMQWKENDVFVEDILTVNDVVDGTDIATANRNYNTSKTITYNTEFMNMITLKNPDDSVIVKEGQSVTFTMDNARVHVTATTGKVLEDCYKLTYYFRYTDGSYSSQVDITDKFSFYAGTNTYGYNFNFTAEKDVKTIFIREYFKPSDSGIVGTKSTLSISYFADPIRFYYEVDSKEAGLLGGILDWIKSIFDKIGDMFDAIVELPSKLWNLISEGLKSLFVPDEQYMTNYSTQWDELLSQRFGALYEVGAIISDFASNIQTSDKINTIYMPQVSLNSVGIPFSFGGYDIQIVPNGFNVVVEICKKIISIVCTFLFINGLRKKYDNVMGVEE